MLQAARILLFCFCFCYLYSCTNETPKVPISEHLREYELFYKEKKERFELLLNTMKIADEWQQLTPDSNCISFGYTTGYEIVILSSNRAINGYYVDSVSSTDSVLKIHSNSTGGKKNVCLLRFADKNRHLAEWTVLENDNNRSTYLGWYKSVPNIPDPSYTDPEKRQLIYFFDRYSIQFNPNSWGFQKSLSDTAKSFIDKIHLRDSILLKRIEVPLEILLLKMYYYHLKNANISFTLTHSGDTQSIKIVKCFLLNNSIDTLSYKRKELGFTSDDAFDLVKLKYEEHEPEYEVKRLIKLIEVERKRLSNR